jgi:chorismate synthase
MPGNLYGQIFSVQTFGESHGPAIGCIVDGVPSGISLSEADIQIYLDKRKPGQSKYTTQRKEPDQVQILSGIFEGQTTGTPIGLLIENQDTRSKDYGDIKDKFRPGHADYTYFKKYGFRDYRGGGRSSARETAMRVAAGAIARKILGSGISIRAALIQIGPHKINRDNWDWAQCSENSFWSPDAAAAETWADYLNGIRKAGSSAGAVIEVVCAGVPVGLGSPLFDKLDGVIAHALMNIPAAKGVEIGAGFEAAELTGDENADEMRMNNGKVEFLSNNAGGMLGGISTGQDIVARVAIKPTSSILIPKRTVTAQGENTEIVTKGRHDPCVGIRGVPVVEAMMACVLADQMLLQRAQFGEQR